MSVICKLTHMNDPQSRIRKWAYENAYTLIFVSVYFMVTWVVVVLASYVIH